MALEFAAALLLAASSAFAQEEKKPPAPPPATLEEPEADSWEFSATLSGYFVPEDRNYVQPTVTADHGWLHLEARYNYEAIESGSAWLGTNFSGGKELEWSFTPMLGGVFGSSTGIAAGYRGSLSWWKLELFSEGEWVIDTGAESGGGFFYAWNELSLAPTDWFRVGLVAQRTRAYETDLSIQRGFFVGFTYKRASITGYMFNPDEDKPLYVLAFGLSF